MPTMPAKVLVVGKFVRGGGILHEHALSRAEHVLENRLWQLTGADGPFSQIDRHSFITARRLGLDSIAVAVWKDQQASLRTGVLQSQAHDLRDQLLQVCLTLHSLRQLEHGGEVQLFNPRQQGPRRIEWWLFIGEIGILRLELPDLSIRAPLPVAGPRVAQVSLGDSLEATCPVEPRGELQGESLVVDEPVLMRRTDGAFV